MRVCMYVYVYMCAYASYFRVHMRVFRRITLNPHVFGVPHSERAYNDNQVLSNKSKYKSSLFKIGVFVFKAYS